MNEIKAFRFLFVFIFSSILLYTTPSQANLIDNGNGTITDDDLGLTWLQTPSGVFEYPEALDWVNGLVFAGFDDWRLPSANSFTTGNPDTLFGSTDNEFGHLYGIELGNPESAVDAGLFSDYTALQYWTGTADALIPGNAYYFFWSYDGIWYNATSSGANAYYVTAVRDIDTAMPVPEPRTLLLAGVGLVLMALLRKRLLAQAGQGEIV